MLTIAVALNPEGWDEEKQEFVPPKTINLQLEHSLVSLAKWESKWGKAFMSKKDKTSEETIDYIRCMTLTKNVDPIVYTRLSQANFKEIENYILAPMTAVYFPDERKKGNAGTVTAELIYYWMIALNIPPEYQKWHLNKLLTLIRVCEMQNRPPKKRSMREIMTRNAALNEARKKQLHTKG